MRARQKQSTTRWASVAVIVSLTGTLASAAMPAPEIRHANRDRLLTHYRDMKTRLRTEIMEAVPMIHAEAMSAFTAARQAQSTARAAVETLQHNFQQIRTAEALVKHAENKWIGGAEQAIAETKAKLAKATVNKERRSLKKRLAHWQRNRTEGEAALEERQAKLDTLKRQEQRWTRELEAAKLRLAEAQAHTRSVPVMDVKALRAYTAAREVEQLARQDVKALKEKLGQVGKAAGLVGHAKHKWIASAQEKIAETKKKLAAAKTAEARQTLERALANWKQNLIEGQHALKERQAKLDAVKREAPTWRRELATAERALAEAETRTTGTITSQGLDDLLDNAALDGRLAKFVILHQATPEGLATFSQKRVSNEALVRRLLSNEPLMIQILIADGARGGQYGRAMEIYSAIQKESPAATSGTLQRLALAVSLEHATPHKQRPPVAQPDASRIVDPVKRYHHFEQAYLKGELDPAFGTFSVWEYRMVVNGDETEEALAWGREMLRNFRPDLTVLPYSRRYVSSVVTELRYGMQWSKDDQPDLQFYQNILMNDGVCGRRAFFGRFILRAFGMPTAARPQPGHAALVHWTPEGWLISFGAQWGSGWTKGLYGPDRNFLATTQAREDPIAFMKVKRAQWIGDVMGEQRTYGFVQNNPEFWNGAALYLQKAMIQTAKTKTLGPSAEGAGENDQFRDAEDAGAHTAISTDRNITIDGTGIITIPATASSAPTESEANIVFMPSVLGGEQLHFARYRGRATLDVEYTVEVPEAGKYALTARVVTPTWKQKLSVRVNATTEPIEIPLPFTVGLWGSTDPIELQLVAGKNTLRFSREASGSVKGLSIKDFTLDPVSR